MVRTERLLQLLQLLRRYRHPVSGKRLAERLGMSLRTLYRDIATLQAQGADIQGEAGVGYVLKPSFFLPPLMFNHDEVQAVILGMRWVTQYGDAPLSKAAEDALAKITHVLPANIKNGIHTFSLRVGPPASKSMHTEDLSALRHAIEHQNVIEITYRSDTGGQRYPRIWPFTIGYFTDGRVLVAWDEKENHYQHFKTNKILSLNILNEHYRRPKNSLFKEWQALQLEKIKN